MALGGQVQDETGSNEVIGECAQAIRVWERSLYGQEDNDKMQEHALSDRGREDLFDIYEDDTSLEYMLSDSEQEDLFAVDEDAPSVGDDGGSVKRTPLDTHGLAWLEVPTQVARELPNKQNGEKDRSTLARVTQCLNMHVRIKQGSGIHQILVTVRPGDKQVVDRVEHMLACIGRDITIGVDTTYPALRATGGD